MSSKRMHQLSELNSGEKVTNGEPSHDKNQPQSVKGAAKIAVKSARLREDTVEDEVDKMSGAEREKQSKSDCGQPAVKRVKMVEQEEKVAGGKPNDSRDVDMPKVATANTEPQESERSESKDEKDEKSEKKDEFVMKDGKLLKNTILVELPLHVPRPVTYVQEWYQEDGRREKRSESESTLPAAKRLEDKQKKAAREKYKALWNSKWQKFSTVSGRPKRVSEDRTNGGRGLTIRQQERRKVGDSPRESTTWVVEVTQELYYPEDEENILDEREQMAERRKLKTKKREKKEVQQSDDDSDDDPKKKLIDDVKKKNQIQFVKDAVENAKLRKATKESKVDEMSEAKSKEQNESDCSQPAVERVKMEEQGEEVAGGEPNDWKDVEMLEIVTESEEGEESEDEDEEEEESEEEDAAESARFREDTVEDEVDEMSEAEREKLSESDCSQPAVERVETDDEPSHDKNQPQSGKDAAENAVKSARLREDTDEGEVDKMSEAEREKQSESDCSQPAVKRVKIEEQEEEVAGGEPNTSRDVDMPEVATVSTKPQEGEELGDRDEEKEEEEDESDDEEMQRTPGRLKRGVEVECLKQEMFYGDNKDEELNKIELMKWHYLRKRKTKEEEKRADRAEEIKKTTVVLLHTKNLPPEVYGEKYYESDYEMVREEVEEEEQYHYTRCQMRKLFNGSSDAMVNRVKGLYKYQLLKYRPPIYLYELCKQKVEKSLSNEEFLKGLFNLFFLELDWLKSLKWSAIGFKLKIYILANGHPCAYKLRSDTGESTWFLEREVKNYEAEEGSWDYVIRCTRLGYENRWYYQKYWLF